jgi:hypothetical protein
VSVRCFMRPAPGDDLTQLLNETPRALHAQYFTLFWCSRPAMANAVVNLWPKVVLLVIDWIRSSLHRSGLTRIMNRPGG